MRGLLDVDVSMRIPKGAGLIRCGCVDEDTKGAGLIEDGAYYSYYSNLCLNMKLCLESVSRKIFIRKVEFFF